MDKKNREDGDKINITSLLAVVLGVTRRSVSIERRSQTIAAKVPPCARDISGGEENRHLGTLRWWFPAHLLDGLAGGCLEGFDEVGRDKPGGARVDDQVGVLSRQVHGVHVDQGFCQAVTGARVCSR